jgi:hypothetical protein
MRWAIICPLLAIATGLSSRSQTGRVGRRRSELAKARAATTNV